MRTLPTADPGTPDRRSPVRYLLWLTRMEIRTVSAGMVMGIIWMVSQAFMPAAIGRAIDEGIAGREHGAAGVVGRRAAVPRHHCRPSPASCDTGSLSTNWLSAAYRTHPGDRAPGHRPRRDAAETAGAPARSSASAPSDISHIGHALDITARGGRRGRRDHHGRRHPARLVGAARADRRDRRTGPDGGGQPADPAAAPAPAGATATSRAR